MSLLFVFIWCSIGVDQYFMESNNPYKMSSLMMYHLPSNLDLQFQLRSEWSRITIEEKGMKKKHFMRQCPRTIKDAISFESYKTRENAWQMLLSYPLVLIKAFRNKIDTNPKTAIAIFSLLNIDVITSKINRILQLVKFISLQREKDVLNYQVDAYMH